jgi:hypothetical protein
VSWGPYVSQAMTTLAIASIPLFFQPNIQRMSDQLAGSLATSTLGRYSGEWQAYCDWLKAYKNNDGYDPFSHRWNHGIVVSLYLSELLEEDINKGIGPNSIQRACAAITFHYQMGGHHISPISHPWCCRIMKVAVKVLVPRKLQRRAIATSEMKELLSYHLLLNSKTLNLRKLMHLVCLLLCFVGLLRFNDMTGVLVHEDLLRFIPAADNQNRDDGMLIFIPRSKTDQSWQGEWVAIGATGKSLCPVFWTRRLLSLGKYVRSSTSNTTDCGPLLRAVKAAPKAQEFLLSQTTSTSTPIPSLSHATISKSAKILLAEASISIDFGLHSLRGGGATAAYLAGIPKTLVCQHGRWKLGTTMDDHYLRTRDVELRTFFNITRKFWPH